MDDPLQKMPSIFYCILIFFHIAAYDLYHIGAEACTAQLFDSCTDFFQACLDVSKNESDPKVAKLFNYSQIQNYDEKNVKKTLQAAQVCWEYFSPKKTVWLFYSKIRNNSNFEKSVIFVVKSLKK